VALHAKNSTSFRRPVLPVQGHLLVPLFPLAAQKVLALGVVLAYPFQATLDEALDLSRVEWQAQVEDFAVVAMVVA
jgi:hypothetical protein